VTLRPEYLDLDSLLTRGRSSGYPVAQVLGQAKTWEDFLREISAWKAALLGVKARRVALHHAQTWDFACALFGAWSASMEVSVPGDALAATAQALEDQVDVFVGDFPETAQQGGKPRLGSVAAGDSRLPGWPKRVSPGLRVFTSGSTGKPEAFTKSFAQLSAEIQCLESTFGADLGSAAVASTVSHQHIYGLLFKVLWPLCAGREFLSQTLFFPEEILAAARRFSSLSLISSPAHLKRLPTGLNWGTVSTQWRAVFSSGGPLSWEAAKLCGELLGKAPVEVYGSSETGGIAWRRRDAEASPWIPFSDVELKLDAGTQCLAVRSPKLPDSNWFSTADRAVFRPAGPPNSAQRSGEGKPDGSFELLGRQDRILKIEEKRISLNAIEAALLGSGLATEAKVLLLPGPRESLGAVVTLHPNARSLDRKALASKLREAVAEKVERVGIPKRWRFAESLPLNAQGKTTQELLLQLFSQADSDETS
jgi:acyl-coenzyme A synthetase/AMP-(fatty) acid ligase